MGVKVILKSGYIKSLQHRENAIEYAANKVEAQLAVLEDGSTVEAGAGDLIQDDGRLAGVRITLASGYTTELTPGQYREEHTI